MYPTFHTTRSGLAACLLALCVAWLPLAALTEPPPADITLTVSPDDPEADFNSVGAAIRKALEYASGDQSTHVLLKSGTYREKVSIFADTALDYAPVAIMAEEAGRAVISGSQVWNGWEVGGSGYFEKEYAGAADVAMVYISGVRLVRVPGDGRLTPGQYKVYGGKVFFLPPAGATVVDGVVEVALEIPEALVRIQNLDTLYVSGLYIRQSGGVGFVLERNWETVVEHCTLEHHFAAGLMVAGAGELVLYNVDALRNGKDGIVAMNTAGLAFVGGSASLNGFRVTEGELRASDTFGFAAKTVQRLALNNLQTADNQGQGLAVLGADEAAITSCKVINNRHGGGLLLQVRDAAVKESTFAANGNLGLVVVDSTCRAAWSIFTGNGTGQAAQVMAVQNAVVSLDRCILSATSLSHPLLVVDGLDNIGTLSGNLYWGSDQPFVFNQGTVALDFPQWQTVSGQDLDSFWGDPVFNDPVRFEFIPRSDSAWYRQKTWPVREVSADDIAAARKELLGVVKTQEAVPETAFEAGGPLSVTPAGQVITGEPASD